MTYTIMNTPLTDEETIRYSRQLAIPSWGEAGQLKLKNAAVFVAGAGGLAGAACHYLAAAGVGKIRLCDSDSVELSNLNRQILHTTGSIGRKKVFSAAERITNLNPDTAVEPIHRRITASSVEDIVMCPDIILDCLDNFSSRMIINSHSVKHRVPLVHGGISGFSGEVALFHPPDTGCLACLFPNPPEEKGIPVFGAAAGVIGSLQALEAVKFLIGLTTYPDITIFDGLSVSFLKAPLVKSPECPVCGGGIKE